MKNVSITVNIEDDWYYAIEAEYNIEKQAKLYLKDFDSFLKECIISLVFSDANYEYMGMYIEKNYKYVCKKIPDYEKEEERCIF